jgi:thiamine pyrophosphokinase
VQAALAHADAARIIAADGGARKALACGLVPDVVIGDMDSLTADELADLRARGAQIVDFPAEKDEIDLELALLYAVEHGARWLRVLGAVGNRLDQVLANIYLLTLGALASCDTRLVSGKQTLWLLDPGTHDLRGEPGDTLSLVPLAGDAVNVRTEGLGYPLRGETLTFGPARGVSNTFEDTQARVAFEGGRLIVVHTVGEPD